jgi:hypothetical protein
MDTFVESQYQLIFFVVKTFQANFGFVDAEEFGKRSELRKSERRKPKRTPKTP